MTAEKIRQMKRKNAKEEQQSGNKSRKSLVFTF